MKLTAEITIDIDEKRKLWINAEAKDVDVEDVQRVSAALTGAVADRALSAYDHAILHYTESSPEAPTETLETFGGPDD